MLPSGDFNMLDDLKKATETNNSKTIFVESPDVKKNTYGNTVLYGNWASTGTGKKGDKRIIIYVNYYSRLYIESSLTYKTTYNVFVLAQERNWLRNWKYKATEVWISGSWQIMIDGYKRYNPSYNYHHMSISNFASSVNPFYGTTSPFESYFTHRGTNPWYSSNPALLEKANWTATRYGGCCGLKSIINYD